MFVMLAIISLANPNKNSDAVVFNKLFAYSWSKSSHINSAVTIMCKPNGLSVTSSFIVKSN